MPKEIERKFLVSSDSWREQAISNRPIVQGYLAVNDRCGVRVRIEGYKAHLNIKSAAIDIVRDEYEYEIPVEQAKEMLARLCGNLVEKERHLVFVDEHRWEVDVFSGANAGLVMAEIELSERNEAFRKPDWLGDEVSNDSRYLNSSLSISPYSTWPKDTSTERPAI